MKKVTSFMYFLVGIYAVMINWHYNHSIFMAILAFFFNVIYLIYAMLTGNLAHGMWAKIPKSYFE